MHVQPAIKKWLTNPKADPSVRLRYWTEIEGKSADDRVVLDAQKSIGQTGWAASLLSHQLGNGQWATPGTSPREIYFPKFVSTNWVAIVLAELGMTRSDPRIQKTAELMQAFQADVLAEKVPEHCIGANAARTLIRFGYLEVPIVQKSIDWLVRSQKPDGGWHCFPSRSGTLDCWEGLAAFAAIPEDARDAPTRRAIERGAEFYLKRGLMKQGPGRYSPWFRIHYPNHYYYDVLVGLRVLTQLGYGKDSRLEPALKWLRSKRAKDGSWAIDAAHPDFEEELPRYYFTRPFFPVMFEPLNKPSQWATVDALGVLARTEST